jgi:hypothetical protein
MKKPSNKVIAVYLAWVLINFGLLVFSPPTRHFVMDGVEFKIYYPTEFFYPFTTGILRYGNGKIWTKEFSSFDLQFYDISEFLFYAIAPILIYYAISFWNKSPKE